MRICNNCRKRKKKYYGENRVCSDCFRFRRYKHRRENPKSVLLNSAKYRASIEGVPFNLNVCDFDIPTVCPILGIMLKSNFGVGGCRDDSPSLDSFV